MSTQTGRVVVIGNAVEMKLPKDSDIQVKVACERCGGGTFINKWQAAKIREINANYSWAPVTLGGKTRPPATVFCWECARDLQIKAKSYPIDKEMLNNV